MICRELMVGGARTFGMETARAFGSAYWFGPQSQREGPWVAPLFTAGNLFYLAILTYMAGKKGLGKPSLLRNLITAYMVITGIVEITRFVWDVSRFALVWAALHNLAEWGIIGFTVFQAKEAGAHWWRSQVWILAVSQVILFAPTLSEGGLYEQIAGLTCDWLLLGVWSYLFHRADQHKRKYVIWGLLGAVGHMLEILPLVSLLIGVVSVPSTFGSALISFTTPITFYCYMRMVQGFDDSGDDDLVTSPAHDDGEPGQDLSVPIPIFSAMVVAALLCSAATILGPVLIIPSCPAAGMVVPPGMVLPPERAAIGAATDLSGTKSGNPMDGKVPAAPGTSGGSGGGGRGIGSNETLCPSQSKLTGTTTIVAKPGMGDKLMEMVATMPGPIRQEDGARYYEEAWGGDNSTTVKFFESWSSIRALYKHIYTSPAVQRVFRSAAFGPMLADKPKLEGPFKAMIPCSEAETEAGTVHIPMSTVIEAPVDCLWDRIDAWSTDCSWVQHSQYITMPNEDMPFLRELHFPSTTVPVIRQVAPLPEPEQPNGGHRLIYYMLGGGFMDTMAEMYRGDLTIVPLSKTKTLFTYTATIVAKDPNLTNALFDSINNDFNSKTGRIQFLQQWGREVANSARCRAAHPPVPPAPAPAPSTSSADYFYVFKLPQDAPTMPDTISMLKYLLSKQPTYPGPEPEVLYAADVGRRNFPATKVPGPDLKKPWSVTLVVRFPTGCTVRPAAVGDGVALDTYRVAVREKKLPSAAAAAKCPDSHTLDKAIKAVQPEVDAMFGNFEKWYRAMQANATDPALPVKPDTPVRCAREPQGQAAMPPPQHAEEPCTTMMSGINLLQYKSGQGIIGQTCYGRYLREAYKLISKYGGGLYYFGEVVDEGSESWDEIVIPLYNDGKAFFKVVFDKRYYGLLGLRDATLSDQANIDVAALSGSIMLIP